MAKNHNPVPKNEDLAEWWAFINAEIPLVEDTSDERGLLRLRNKVAQTVARRQRPLQTLPVNPARYEGGVGDHFQFVFEHATA